MQTPGEKGRRPYVIVHAAALDEAKPWLHTRREIEARAKTKAMAKEAEKKMAQGQEGPTQGKKPSGPQPQGPPSQPQPKDQYNFSDPESRILKAGNGNHFEQAYNAQAVVEVESLLI